MQFMLRDGISTWHCGLVTISKSAVVQVMLCDEDDVEDATVTGQLRS